MLYGFGTDPDFMYWGNTDRTFDGAHEAVNGTYKTAVGDFDSDGFDDLLWYSSGLTSYIWWGHAGRDTSGTEFSVTITGATPIVGDFDADTHADIFWYRAGEASDEIWYGRSDRNFDKTTGANVKGSYIPGTGDFDGDGAADIFWYGPGADADRIWYGSTTSRTFTISKAVPVRGTYSWLAIGDFDADGDDDIFWNKPGETDSLWLFTGRDEYDITKASYVGNERPAVGDFDGNGVDDIFWYAKN